MIASTYSVQFLAKSGLAICSRFDIHR